MIQTLASHTAQKAFTDGISPWCAIRCFQELDAAGGGQACETGSKLAITIVNEILRSLSKGSCFSQLLCGPGIGRRASDPHMDHFARVQFDDEEGEQRTEEEIGDRQEGLPGLPACSRCAHLPQIFLNGAFRNVNAQLEQFAPDAFCSPQSIVPGHLASSRRRSPGIFSA